MAGLSIEAAPGHTFNEAAVLKLFERPRRGTPRDVAAAGGHPHRKPDPSIVIPVVGASNLDQNGPGGAAKREVGRGI